MCGIIGIVSKSGFKKADISNRINKALSVINHRGPDSSGIYTNKNVNFGHVRLSILDLSEAAKQPMKSIHTDNVITYNGEVYNFEGLAVKHKIDDRFSTSDTEIVLQLYLPIVHT